MRSILARPSWILAIGLVAPLVAAEGPGPWFVDMASELGMDQRGTGRGTVAFDFDGDGWVDIFQAHSDGPNALYRNLGNGFREVTEAAGVAGEQFHWGVTVGDYDNDGDSDLYLSVGGFEGSGPNKLYRNDGHFFTDVAGELGVAGPDSKSAAPVWIDYDHDGWLDLFVVNYNPFPLLQGEEDIPPCSQHVLDRMTARGESPPAEAVEASNFLYRNDQDGTFTDVTLEAGLELTDRSFGVTTGDYDNDGWTDIYLAVFKGPNRLYRNLGDGTFDEVAAAAGGLDTPWASMSPTFADFNNDGWLDLYIGTWNSLRTGVPDPGEQNFLFINQGDGTFREFAQAAGVEHIGGHMGVQVADFDLDGWLDIYVGSGGPNPWERQQDILYRNTGDGGFHESPPEVSGIDNLFMAHGVAFADFDRDGDLDFYVGNGGPANKGDWSNQPNRFYINQGRPNNSIFLGFEGTVSNRSGLGLVVEAVDGGRLQRRELNGGGGFASQNGLVVALGFGRAESVDRVTVTWPSGLRQTLFDVNVNRRVTLKEPPIGIDFAPAPEVSDRHVDLTVDLRNAGRARAAILEIDIVDSERRTVAELDPVQLQFDTGAARVLSRTWTAPEGASGTFFAVARLIDRDSVDELNLGVAPIEIVPSDSR